MCVILVNFTVITFIFGLMNDYNFLWKTTCKSKLKAWEFQTISCPHENTISSGSRDNDLRGLIAVKVILLVNRQVMSNFTYINCKKKKAS